MLTFVNWVIRFGLYTLLLFVPLLFTGDTSELFEFNKLWFTFGVTIIIGAAWISKMIIQKKIIFQRTPLDIPIGLFLLSQILSTFFSIDPHVSWWGYYSRFNGGLLSIITYIFLYYALASNIATSIKNPQTGKMETIFNTAFIHRLLQVSLISGLITALWGLPSHFGYDPTCLVFRGTLDVSCWTNAFQPKVRIFSTLGQPDWFAAYLSILLPISITYAITAYHKTKQLFSTMYYLFLTTLFFIDILYTNSRGSYVALLVSLCIFFILYAYTKFRRDKQFSIKKWKIELSILAVFILISFFIPSPIAQLNKFTFGEIKNHFAAKQSSMQTTTTKTTTPKTNAITGELGGTDSGKIRLYVWTGALDIWKHYPLFGSGVETFAFAYYQFRPIGHNLTSEWDYLYNKAHNEYLNYLATTGAFGLLSYLSLIIGTIIFTLRYLKKKKDLLIWALLISYFTIIISNFFGFSVVIVNIYFFLIPLCIFILGHIGPFGITLLDEVEKKTESTNVGQKVGLIIIWLIAFYLILVLLNYWNADKSYGLGNNLDRAGEYQQAYKPLHNAVAARPDEPVFQDELAINDAVLATALLSQKDVTDTVKTTANQLIQEALTTTQNLTTQYPHNVTFWKSRVRVLYSLAQIDPQYLPLALEAIIKARDLAPTDAKISYNLGLLYTQNGQVDKGIEVLEYTTKMKSDYRDAYYALGLLLHQEAIDKAGNVINPLKQAAAIKTMTFITHTLNPGDSAATEALKSWNAL